MRRLKLILGGLAVLLVALLVAGYVALVSLDLESYRGTLERRAEAATGRALTLAGPMDLAVDFSPAITVRDVRLANADWGSRPDMARVQRFELEVALLPLIRGEIRVRRLVLVQPDILLETDAQGRGNWIMSGRTDGGLGGRLPSLQSVRIEQGRLVLRDGGTGRSFDVELERATLTERGADRLAVDADGSYRSTPFELTGEVGRLARFAKADGRFPLDLTLTAAGARVQVSGAIDQAGADPEPDLDVKAEAERLADLDALFAARLPTAGPVALKARVRGIDGGFGFSGLKLEIGESDLAGEGELRLSGDRATLTGRFTSARLDLPALTAGLDTTGLDTGAGSGDGRVFPDTPLPLGALGLADGELSLKVGTLRLGPKLAAGEVELQATLKDRVLHVASAQGGLFGGRFQVRGRLDAGVRPASLDADLSARDVDYGRLLRELAGRKGISGTASLKARLTGRGDSPRALAASLGGDLQVTGGEGRVRDALLDAAGAGLGDVLAPWAEGDDDMNLNCVVGRFDLKDGVAESRAILADTDDVTLVGDGTVDLGRERYDLRLTPKAKQTSLASLAVPMRMTGPLMDPRVGPDPVGAAKAGAIAIGSLVNPLVTLGALVLDSETQDQNPCVAALEKAKAKAGRPSGGSASGGGSSGGGASGRDGGNKGGIKGFLDGLSDSIDRTLGVE